MPMSKISGGPTNLTAGLMVAITAGKILALRAICPAMSSATKIWTTTVTGATIQTMATCGSQPMLKQDGRPITKAIGIGFLPGDTPGSMTPTGATLPSTTGAG